MTDFKKMVGDDDTAAFLREMRARIGDQYSNWTEVEPIIYDALKEFERLPLVNIKVEFAGFEKLTPAERQNVGDWVSTFAADYGSRCRRDVLAALVIDRLKLWSLQKG